MEARTETGTPTRVDEGRGADQGRRILGRLGVWSGLDALPAGDVARYAQQVEAMGLSALWINETVGREPFALLGFLARVTDRIGLGVGIASIYLRSAHSARAGAWTVAELSGGRFVMGLGVSHRERVEAILGVSYQPPLTAMRAYLDAYEAATYQGPPPPVSPPLVLAALGEGMLRLAATRTAGAFPYLVPSEAVARARRIVDQAAPGRRPLVVVTCPAVLASGPAEGREAARRYFARHLRQENYRRSLRACGFSEEEITPPGADRLADALVAWGRAQDLRRRIADYWAAGADHVAVIPLAADGQAPALAVVEAVASLAGSV